MQVVNPAGGSTGVHGSAYTGVNCQRSIQTRWTHHNRHKHPKTILQKDFRETDLKSGGCGKGGGSAFARAYGGFLSYISGTPCPSRYAKTIFKIHSTNTH